MWRTVSLVGMSLVSMLAFGATPQISASMSSALFLHSDGSVWALGGVAGYSPGTPQPVRFLNLRNVIKVQSNCGTDYALLGDGTVWAIGNNSVGQVGDGTTNNATQPVQVRELTQITDISGGDCNSAFALRSDGTVWAWGQNEDGSLGDGTLMNRSSPVQVIGLSNIIKVAGRSALAADGTVWAWGGAISGDGVYHPCCVTKALHVPRLDNVVSIAHSGFNYFAIQADGSVWAWGSWNGDGALGLGTTNPSYAPQKIPGLNNVTAIATSSTVSLALKSDGTVWAAGSNLNNELGRSGGEASLVHVQVAGLSNIVAIAVGGRQLEITGYALAADGTVYAWGANQTFQLGDGSMTSRPTPRAIVGPGGQGTLNLLRSAPATYNQPPNCNLSVSQNSGKAPLGIAATATASDADGRIANYLLMANDGQSVSAQNASFIFTQPGNIVLTLIASDDQGGKCTARQTITVAFDPTLTTRATPKAVMGWYSMALSSDGRVWYWGGTGKASLPVDSGIRGAIDISVGHLQAYALTDQGLIYATGGNEDGALGVNTESWLNSFVRVTGIPAIKAIAPSTNRNHQLVIGINGRVYAWGRNQEGQLGVGDVINRPLPVVIPDLDQVNDVAAGGNFSLALRADGSVWAWGDNAGYQLGDGTRTARSRPAPVAGLADITRIFAGENCWFAIDRQGAVWGVGPVPFGERMNPRNYRLGPKRMPALDGVKKLIASFTHAHALKTDDTVLAWGYAIAEGRPAIGIPGAGDVPDPTPVPDLTDIIDIQGTGDTRWIATFALRRDGTVLAWGTQRFGELGDGTYATRTSPGYVLNAAGTDVLDLDPAKPKQLVAAFLPLYYFRANAQSGSLSTTLTDTRAAGISGSVYFNGLLPPTSPLLKTTGAASPNAFAASGGMVPVSFGRGGVKQTGPAVAAEPVATQSLTSGNQFAVYSDAPSDPLTNSNAIICMGIALPSLSAKGQVLMRAIANGDQDVGVTQCPTVQTEATMKLYTSQVSGTTANRTIVAMVQAQPEDYGQQRNLYSWAVAPDGRQFMQTGPNAWAFMSEPMSAAATVTIPADGSPVTLPVVQNLDLSTLVGTLVYVGLGSSWAEVKQLNKAGHYYTAQ